MMSANSDVAKAMTTMAAQRIAAYADKRGIPIDAAQCEEIAADMFGVYQAFLAGVQHASGHAPSADR